MKLFKLTLLLAAIMVFATDYVVAQTGSVSGVVFDDVDGDGEADPGENVEPNVTVSLVDAGGNVIATVVTGDDGSYSFTNVPAGVDYTLQFTYPVTPPLTVQTQPFTLADGADYEFNAPVVAQTTGFNTTSPNLSVVNPASVRGPSVSPFTP